MFVVTGKLSGKSFIKQGVSEKGAWKIITFLIDKTRNRKPIKIPITAKGKLADKIEQIPAGEKLVVRFFIEGKKYNDKYFTECVAYEIEKYVPKAKYRGYFNANAFTEREDERDFEFGKDLTLFNVT